MSDDNVVTIHKPLDPLVGPFVEEYRVVVEGRAIPMLTGMHDGVMTTLIVDRRFGVTVPREYAYAVASALANALAIGAGYSSLNATSKDRPFAPQVFEVGQ